ncbi:MAG TPA: transposase [Thiotrichales bacterium]|nr:transposase [Thiotrichales bacterium]
MTRPRHELVSLDETPYYHCMSRCVRRAYLCGKDPKSGENLDHRKKWIVDRLRELTNAFAIDVAAYAVMSNHYHLVLHVDRSRALGWSLGEVIERWGRLFALPPLVERYQAGEALGVTEREVVEAQVEVWRTRLFDLGWFMRAINEWVARRANEEDRVGGRFWEGRYKCQALLDDAALLACMAYVDLNPVRAEEAETPEESEYTALRSRVDYRSRGGDHDGAPAGLMPFGGGEREDLPSSMLPFDFHHYLALVDWTGRAVREDKPGAIPQDLAPILERLGIEAGAWFDSVNNFEARFLRVLGPVERIRSLAKAVGRKWFQGITRCLRFYRSCPA